LNHVVELTKDHGLGIVMEDEAAQTLLSKGADIKNSKDLKDVKDLK
jgi:LETM1 and EF-hand domain-containing protein 1